MTKVGIVSLGCPKNLVDSEQMLGALAQAGCEIVSDKREAEVILINTCGFIESAKEESLDTILEMIRLKGAGACKSVIVAGCLAQRYADELSREIPEVDAFVGVGQIAALPGIVQLTLDGHRVVDNSRPARQWVEFEARIRATPPWTAYLKISDGCDNRCSYCAIPEIRGLFRSRPSDRIVAEAEILAAEGVKEIVLVGQDLTRYGSDTHESLVSLLRRLARVEGPTWIRLMYCYPTRISDDLIEVIASEPKIAKYIDVPLQHADDDVLRRMNRLGSSDEYLALLRRIRAACPDMALRTSMIVGFPGETLEEFERLVDFVREARFDRMGVFEYSREEGTPAADIAPRIGAATKRRRRDRLMREQQRVSLEMNKGFIGREIDVLAERNDRGRSYRDAPDVDGVVLLNGFKGAPGEMVRARVTDATEYDLVANVIDEV
ncbi:MAG: 30S ribosomal protein S12 methylthiotransferase RimO [Armatimonadota bacterium]|nr:30S ribosomal protein S12 methylthiotransferase RimO [Armatimonadota bacterium]